MIALLCVFIVSFIVLQIPCTWVESFFYVGNAGCIDLKTTIGLVSFTSLASFVSLFLYFILVWIKEHINL